MQDILKLLDYAPVEGISNLCDIGMGQGHISYYFAEKGIHVTGTGLEVASYGIDLKQLSSRNIDVVECRVEQMPFEAESFDAVVASHILEHVPNMGLALQEIRRILKKDGWLFLFLPEYVDYVLAGHINTGWNLSQLMYVLLLNGFDIKNGHFINSKSLCAYVRKTDAKLPPLRGDRGDIHILYQNGFFPFEIRPDWENLSDGWDAGSIQAVNWNNADEILECKLKGNKKYRITNLLIKILTVIIGHRRVRVLGQLMRAPEIIINPATVSKHDER